jgi:hypothetical protein
MLADMNRVLPRLTTQANNSPSYSINNQKESSNIVESLSLSQTRSHDSVKLAYSTPGSHAKYLFRSPILDQATAKARENQDGGIFKMFGMA